MRDIKVKEKRLGNIKTLDKTIAWTERVKDPIVYLNKKLNSSVENEENATDYGNDKVNFVINRIKDESIYAIKKTSNNSVEYVKKKYQQKKLIKSKKKINENKFKVKEKNPLNTLFKNDKNFKEKVSGQKRMLEECKKKVSKGAKRTYQISKKISEVIVSTIKGIICGAKSLVGLLIAGGTLSVVVIIIVCFIGLLTTSVFGLFFSSEDIGKNNPKMSECISEINLELNSKIRQLEESDVYDEIIINSEKMAWQNVLVIYAALVTNGHDNTSLISMTNERKVLLRKVFWEMNNITSSVENFNSKKTLKIEINTKSVEEMISFYKFNNIQSLQVKELLNDKYSSLWSMVIYNTPIGSDDMVEIALSQVGNVGGEPYWRWYGFNSRIEWCAVFVSWVANQAGYIDKGVAPKFTTCRTQGVPWFKNRGLWENRGYIPKSGDIIFFDWQQDGQADHVGIVERVEGEKIYTIEGNSDDAVKRNNYQVNSKDIYGFGVIKNIK